MEQQGKVCEGATSDLPLPEGFPNFERKGSDVLSSTTISSDLVNMIAEEMASGVDRAVECWMSQIDEALTDARLTSLGRLQAVRQVVEKYKELTGKAQLRARGGQL